MLRCPKCSKPMKFMHVNSWGGDYKQACFCCNDCGVYADIKGVPEFADNEGNVIHN